METPNHDEQEPTTWTTKEGQVLNIADMTTEHLQNVQRMLDRADLAFYATEFGQRVVGGWEKYDARPPPNSHPAYVPIVKELYRRGEITHDDMEELFGWEGVD